MSTTNLPDVELKVMLIKKQITDFICNDDDGFMLEQTYIKSSHGMFMNVELPFNSDSLIIYIIIDINNFAVIDIPSINKQMIVKSFEDFKYLAINISDIIVKNPIKCDNSYLIADKDKNRFSVM